MSRTFLPVLMMFVGVEAIAEGPLDQEINLSVDRITTEQALVRVAGEIGLTLEIQRNELQKQGISKNQSFAIDLRNVPARQALRMILLKGDSKGRLAYFVREDGTIVVTTIYAADLKS